MFAEDVAESRGTTLAELAMGDESVYRCWCGDNRCHGFVMMARTTAQRYKNQGYNVVGGVDLRGSLWP